MLCWGQARGGFGIPLLSVLPSSVPSCALDHCPQRQQAPAESLVLIRDSRKVRCLRLSVTTASDGWCWPWQPANRSPPEA